MRENVRFLEDHLVDVGVPVIAGLHEERHRCDRDAGCELVTDDLGHGDSARAGNRVEESLRHAISDRRVETPAFDRERVDLARGVAEAGDLHAAQQRRNVTLDQLRSRVREEE